MLIDPLHFTKEKGKIDGGDGTTAKLITLHRTSKAKDQSNLLYLVLDIDTMQYVDANNEDTNQRSDHTSEVHDNRFHFDEAFELIQTFS